MVSAFQNGNHFTPGHEAQHPSAPHVIMSTVPATTPIDPGRSAQAAQQALYRGISNTLGSTCRPLVYSSLTNRYSPSNVLAQVQPEQNSMPMHQPHPHGLYQFEQPSFPVLQRDPHGGYCRGVSSAPPPSSDGYFREPFLPPVFGQGQKWFASAFNPRDYNHPYYTHPPPPPHSWLPPPEVVTEDPLLPDYLSDEIPFESHHVGCQVADDLFGNASPIPNILLLVSRLVLIIFLRLFRLLLKMLLRLLSKMRPSFLFRPLMIRRYRGRIMLVNFVPLWWSVICRIS